MNEKISKTTADSDFLESDENLRAGGEEDKGRPSVWKTESDTSEEFVTLFSEEFMELIDASSIEGTARDDVKGAVWAILTEGLLPANEQLLKIRASAGQNVRPQIYEDFSRDLWHAYKDLMPRAALLLGFDLGFLFQKESAFKKGVVRFDMDHPVLIAPNLGGFFRRQRMGWQSNLARFRNHFLDPQPDDRKKFAAFYEPHNTEMLFSVVWGVMANTFPVFIEANFPEGLTIELLPEEKRVAFNGKRFRFLKAKR
jgi:hypothetical protein